MSLNRRDCLKLTSMLAASSSFPSQALGAAGASAEGRPRAVAIVPSAGVGHDYRPALKLLCEYVDAHLEAYGLPGITVSVTDAEGLKAVISAGWSDVDRREAVTPEHLFQIGSISKSFAGLAILRLVDTGKLDLDTEVRELLPGVALPDSVRITIRHLLTHTSGLAADAPLFPCGEGGELWVGFDPGSRFSYSNLGYSLLGAVVEHLQQMPYHEALTRNVLTPLGLGAVLPRISASDRARYAASYYPYYIDRPFPRRGRQVRAPWINFSSAAGCIGATSRQMADYARWLIQAARGDGAPLLSEPSRRAYLAPAVPISIFGPGAHYALGLGVLPIDGDVCLHHTGGMLSFVSALTVDPTNGVGAFASVNARAEEAYRPAAVTRYAIQLLRAVREHRSLPAAPPIPSATHFEGAKALIGRYRGSDGDEIELIASGDGLGLRHSGIVRALQPADPDSFIAVGPGDESFNLLLRTDNGSVHSVGWGSQLYRADTLVQPEPLPHEIQRLAGVYDSDNLWTGQHEVSARADGLWLDGTTPLTPLNDGSFRVGREEWSPERVRFSGDLNGQPVRMSFSSIDFIRV
jgi:CubicO group peptidase (beta-lactamase class C family)